MKNAKHESHLIAMQNLSDTIGKAGHSDPDGIITAWEMEDRFLFILKDGEGSGFFSLNEFHKDTGEFGGDVVGYGCLDECWDVLERLQEEARTP